MIIKGIKYSRYPNMPREWQVVGKDDESNNAYVLFSNLNLLVGKNAAGKSRTLNAIRELANMISGRQLVKNSRYHTQYFDFVFTDNGDEYRYILSFKNKIILAEILTMNGEELIDRQKGFFVSLGEKKPISSSFDQETLLITKKRSSEEFYFSKMVFWGMSLRTFMFSDQVEKDKYIDDLNSIEKEGQDLEDLGIIIPIFHWARKEYGQKFEDEILECMADIGYQITDIDIRQLKSGYCINVEEDGKYMVSQQEMSQGMFRALALFIILINARWRKLSVCILVDDVGEGLDYQRSKGIVDLIIRKTFETDIQYFMSTNDRYVMNQIHLKYWSVVEREGAKSVFYNLTNSKQNFEDFRYTGLNNFDFYTTDFYRNGFGDDENNEEEINKSL